MTATADLGLPPGEWIQGRHGTRRFRHAPDTERLRHLQERTILEILLATRKREREALTELLRIARRQPRRKAA